MNASILDIIYTLHTNILQVHVVFETKSLCAYNVTSYNSLGLLNPQIQGKILSMPENNIDNILNHLLPIITHAACMLTAKQNVYNAVQKRKTVLTEQ